MLGKYGGESPKQLTDLALVMRKWQGSDELWRVEVSQVKNRGRGSMKIGWLGKRLGSRRELEILGQPGAQELGGLRGQWGATVYAEAGPQVLSISSQRHGDRYRIWAGL